MEIFNMLIRACFHLLLLCFVTCERGGSIGCYSLVPSNWTTHSGGSVDVCLNSCEDFYFKYALLSKGSVCNCGNTPGDTVSTLNCDMPCLRNHSQICGGDKASSVYDTNVNVPGPPENFVITNITDRSIDVQWAEPKAHGEIFGYKIGAVPLHTYSGMALNNLEWHFSNESFHADLPNLLPCTSYNVSARAIGEKDFGFPTFKIVETNIGEPDPVPQQPTVIEHHNDKIVIRIPEAFNYNGPVSKYHLVVVKGNLKSKFSSEYLKSYEEASQDGLPYYITAELDPEDIKTSFIVGDGRTYNGYYNAPLDTMDIRLAVGIVSIRNGITKARYAQDELVRYEIVNQDQGTYGNSAMILGLGVAIGVSVIVVVVGLAVLLMLRHRRSHLRRHRLSQSMPLSEPCIENDNSGIFPEEERIDHYSNLALHSWNIPRNFLEVENSNIVGIGNFGQFVRGHVQQHGTQVPALVQAIADQSFDRDRKKSMLLELDMLIKSNGHNNIIALIGICELPDTLYVVLEDANNTLKDFLISSRQHDVQNNKFTLVSEMKMLQICLGVTKGMEFLASKKIMHKKLCCRNVCMADNTVPKITGFGLSYMHPLDRKPDYTRWTAQEMFKQSRYTTYSEVWSYGCLLWEIFSLGATLYPNVSNKDVSARVLRGMRPAQLSYIGDEVYQTCLECWQLDLNERPTFHHLSLRIEKLMKNFIGGLLSFTYYQNFQYEPYNPEMEFES